MDCSPVYWKNAAEYVDCWPPAAQAIRKENNSLHI